jgi:hypothetical protein
MASVDLADQLGIAGRQVVDQIPARVAPGDRIRVLVDAPPREQRRVGVRRAERHGVVRADAAQGRQH